MKLFGTKTCVDQEPHPFAGCDRLLGQYRIVGSELLKLHGAAGRYSGRPTSGATQTFRRSLAFIPTEVLTSYREDLLDPEIHIERLFIGEDRAGWQVPLFAATGIVLAVALGVYAASVGASFTLSLLLTLIISSPFLAIWHLVPRDGSLRRLRYAQWLSEEIAYRNGSDKGGRAEGRNTGLLSPLWFPEGDPSVKGGAVSRARILH